MREVIGEHIPGEEPCGPETKGGVESDGAESDEFGVFAGKDGIEFVIGERFFSDAVWGGSLMDVLHGIGEALIDGADGGEDIPDAGDRVVIGVYGSHGSEFVACPFGADGSCHLPCPADIRMMFVEPLEEVCPVFEVLAECGVGAGLSGRVGDELSPDLWELESSLLAESFFFCLESVELSFDGCEELSFVPMCSEWEKDGVSECLSLSEFGGTEGLSEEDSLDHGAEVPRFVSEDEVFGVWPMFLV